MLNQYLLGNGEANPRPGRIETTRFVDLEEKRKQFLEVFFLHPNAGVRNVHDEFRAAAAAAAAARGIERGIRHLPLTKSREIFSRMEYSSI